jgi:hypothetical protein
MKFTLEMIRPKYSIVDAAMLLILGVAIGGSRPRSTVWLLCGGLLICVLVFAVEEIMLMELEPPKESGR